MPEETVTVSPEVSEAASTPAPESAPSSSSPPATPAEKSGTSPKETLLDAVLKVVPESTEKDALADSADKAHPEAPVEGEEAKADPEDDDDAEPPAEAGNALLRRKVSKLLASRYEIKQQLTAATEQLETLRPQAEIGSQMETFARENDLSGEDVAKLLNIGAMVRRGDYAGFYEAVAPIVRKAQEYLGHAVPSDLRERVSQGHMTEAAAREFARLRMDQQRAEISRTTEQQTHAQRALAQTQDQVGRSVTAFEEKLAAGDPDYKQKAASVKRVAQGMLLDRGGHIQTVEDALQITKAAYDEVNAMIRKYQPAPHATSKTPNGNGQTRAARPEPSSPFEAALQGLERSRNGAGLP